jgi:hypothetical protein
MPQILFYCVALIAAPSVLGFSVGPPCRKFRSSPLLSSAVDGLSDERKAVVFQALLRDLQIEDVPLLGADSDQVHTFQAAMWTTMAELTDQPNAAKACLILENIPMAALKTWVDDFFILKTQQDQLQYLPEIQRISASLVGKGVGPAILLEVTKGETTLPFSEYNEFACSAAMKVFVDRVVVGNDSPTSVGLGDEGSAAPIEYRFGGSSNACATLASFWNCACEMLSSDDQPGTLCLQIPSYSSNFGKFNVVTALMGRTLCLYQGDAVLSLVHFHPHYDRSLVTPIAKPAFGHLPPVSWMRPMFNAFGVGQELSDEDLALGDYQRKSPIAAVNIVRNSLLADPKIVEVELNDGTKTQASGLEVYCGNAIKLAQIGKDVLQAAHDAEVKIVN